MPPRRIGCCLLTVLVTLIAACCGAQCGAQSRARESDPPDPASYRFHIPVDEVSLTFHATDANGLPVDNLHLRELTILDNDQAPLRVLAFQSLRDLPIRAGFLLDTSASMEQHLARDQAIAMEYAQRLLRKQTDQAFVMDFARLAQITQPWTSDPVALRAGLGELATYGGARLTGTAVFDAVYRACSNNFVRDAAPTGNFLLLFSDGDDNASQASLQQAVDICQTTHTAIYAFLSEEQDAPSTGPRTLRALAAQTGGRVFHADDSEAAIYADLRAIEADRRDQYRLVYKPAELKHDGSFHEIELLGPERVDHIAVRSGYYATAP